MRKVAAVLGAGFSHVAGLPLAKDLLAGHVYVPSKAAAGRWAAVLEDFERWKDRHPGEGPEQYLGHLYRASWGREAVLWPSAVELVVATVATPRSSGDVLVAGPRYSSLITRPYHCSAHHDLWQLILTRTSLIGVVTSNWDLLAERSLRHRPVAGKPGCHYGGLPIPQLLEGRGSQFQATWTQEPVRLTGGVPIYKLHGSINWVRTQDGVTMYVDVRPAFRSNTTCAIIPPVPEKATPAWLAPIWQAAEQCLQEADDWLVCGYSLPPYDLAAREMLRRAASGDSKRILLMSPNSSELAERWQDVAANSTILPLRGLPEGTEQATPYFDQ
jgi:hypothetical protein